MGTLAVDSDNSHSDLYLQLGLKISSKAGSGYPMVLSVLSSSLERSIQKNDKLLESMEIKDSATVFHGMKTPAIRIKQYLDRIFKYSGCSPSCFVIAQIYVDRFLQETSLHLTSRNVHRLVITSLMLAAKLFDDRFFNNAYYARVGGVTTRELNRLEMKFLFTVSFKLHVSLKTFHTYCCQLEKEASQDVQIERPIIQCRATETWQKKADSHAQTITR